MNFKELFSFVSECSRPKHIHMSAVHIMQLHSSVLYVGNSVLMFLRYSELSTDCPHYTDAGGLSPSFTRSLHCTLSAHSPMQSPPLSLSHCFLHLGGVCKTDTVRLRWGHGQGCPFLCVLEHRGDPARVGMSRDQTRHAVQRAPHTNERTVLCSALSDVQLINQFAK